MDEAQIVNGFWRAAYGEIAWETAIDAIALPLDCRAGQIAVIDRKAGLIASAMSRMTAADLRDMETHRVASPSVNPRILGILRAAPGQCITDDDIMSADERRRLPIYHDFFMPTGTESVALLRSSDTAGEACIALAMLGREAGLATTAPMRRLLERLLPAITDATRLAMRFGRMKANAMAAALEDHRRPCIALRRDMVMTAISPSAEGLLSSGQYLTMRGGRLHASHRDSDRNLHDRVARIAALDPNAMRRGLIALYSATHDAPAIVASLMPVPDRSDLFETCALLTLASQTAQDDVSELLADVYRLTPTEAAVSIAIAAGQSPTQIATERGQSRETVRTHLRSIRQKTGTHRQSEVAALIGRLQG